MTRQELWGTPHDRVNGRDWLESVTNMVFDFDQLGKTETTRVLEQWRQIIGWEEIAGWCGQTCQRQSLNQVVPWQQRGPGQQHGWCHYRRPKQLTQLNVYGGMQIARLVKFVGNLASQWNTNWVAVALSIRLEINDRFEIGRKEFKSSGMRDRFTRHALT